MCRWRHPRLFQRGCKGDFKTKLYATHSLAAKKYKWVSEWPKYSIMQKVKADINKVSYIILGNFFNIK